MNKWGLYLLIALLNTVVNPNPYLSALLIIVDSQPHLIVWWQIRYFFTWNTWTLTSLRWENLAKIRWSQPAPKQPVTRDSLRCSQKDQRASISNKIYLKYYAHLSPPDDLTCWKSPFQEPYLARTGPNRSRSKTNLNLTSFSCRLGRWRWCPAWLGWSWRVPSSCCWWPERTWFRSTIVFGVGVLAGLLLLLSLAWIARLVPAGTYCDTAHSTIPSNHYCGKPGSDDLLTGV